MSAVERLSKVTLDGFHLSLEDVIHVAREHWSVAPIERGTDVYERVEASRAWVDQAVERNAELAQAGQPARAYYGINTGFGIHAGGRPLSDPDRTRQAARKLIMSHATGVGEYLDEDIVRATMLIRANTLARGRSAVRPSIINLLVEMLNRDILPAVPQMGSLGASGDLAPLAHLALVISRPPESMIDEETAPGFGEITGEASIPVYDPSGNVIGREIVSGAAALTWDGEDQRAVLQAKEGLALNNGATFSAAMGVLALTDAENLVRHAEISAAMCLEALLGYRDAFLPQIQNARNHPGQIATAANVRMIAQGSRLPDPGDEETDPLRQPPQDPYSLRCVPQVVGAVRETLAHTREMLEREINAATDNPLIFVDDDDLPRDYKAISGGNFHGEPVAFACDAMSIALTELGSISERRIFWLMNPHMNRGLPSMLVQSDDTHIDSGLMIAQYVAASLVSKCKTLAHPDSVDSIPSSADQEDHVSMSMNAGLHTREIVEHITGVIAIEMVSVITALRHRMNLMAISEIDLGAGTQVVFNALRQISPQVFEIPLDRDVVYYPYIRQMTDVIKSGGLIDALREAGYRFKEVRSVTSVVE
jgi:histidine ammonia-lyase